MENKSELRSILTFVQKLWSNNVKKGDALEAIFVLVNNDEVSKKLRKAATVIAHYYIEFVKEKNDLK